MSRRIIPQSQGSRNAANTEIFKSPYFLQMHRYNAVDDDDDEVRNLT